MAATAALCLILLVFFISMVRARILTLRLNSSHDDLSTSDENQSSSPISANCGGPSIRSTCNHQYGFLPCAENGAGYVFQILVYQGLLMFREKQMAWEVRSSFILSELERLVKRLVFPHVVSGVFSSKENAQSQVSLGVGIYAGMTVFSLTLQWGICVIFGRRELTDKSKEHTEASRSNCLPAKEKLIILKDTGLLVDQGTRLFPTLLCSYLISSTPAKRLMTFIALVVSSLSLIAYFSYQIRNPWIQQRSLDYANYETLQTRFLEHVMQQGRLVNEDGTFNTDAMRKFFAEIDKDKDRRITHSELEKLVLDVITTGKMNIDHKMAISDIMKTFDFNNDGCINEQEFIEGCKKWIEEAKQSPENYFLNSTSIFQALLQLFRERKDNDPQGIERIMSKILKHAESPVTYHTGRKAKY
ncbi:Sodium/calcium exchanger NCL1 [Sesamum alatum]|uniref:Sodium/calcium exchanger NCL1 n=1 Tax=Sesamum alatum TaxID=300844 RepID=A0AAE1Z198_9LAMI|nr:Sodium/calcium exchanger NCL1 [Sesamum alatum]